MIAKEYSSCVFKQALCNESKSSWKENLIIRGFFNLLEGEFNMAKKIDVKVGMYCAKCKTQVLKAVTKLEGIDQVTVDGDKGMLIVVGNVDPVLVIKVLRKVGKVADLISVGPPKIPDPVPNKSPTKPSLPICCNDCRLVAVSFPYEPASFCTIL